MSWRRAFLDGLGLAGGYLYWLALGFAFVDYVAAE